LKSTERETKIFIKSFQEREEEEEEEEDER